MGVANRLGCKTIMVGRIVLGGNGPWGLSTMGESSKGRIVQRLGDTSMGQNVLLLLYNIGTIAIFQLNSRCGFVPVNDSAMQLGVKHIIIYSIVLLFYLSLVLPLDHREREREREREKVRERDRT